MTCLCLTRNRREWLPQAIRCFQRQTYPHRELLIVADGADVRDLVPSDDFIRLVQTDGCPQIGEKRNFGAARAAGEIIAHWDDDDYSAPGRLSDQVERLRNTGKAVTGYYSMRFTDGSDWWLYSGASCYSIGTSLCYRREWWEKHPFRSLQIGEDNQFVGEALTAGQLATAAAANLMFARIHPGNSSKKNTRSEEWKPAWVAPEIG